jgi:hypothetical protein
MGQHVRLTRAGRDTVVASAWDTTEDGVFKQLHSDRTIKYVIGNAYRATSELVCKMLFLFPFSLLVFRFEFEKLFWQRHRIAPYRPDVEQCSDNGLSNNWTTYILQNIQTFVIPANDQYIKAV